MEKNAKLAEEMIYLQMCGWPIRAKIPTNSRRNVYQSYSGETSGIGGGDGGGGENGGDGGNGGCCGC